MTENSYTHQNILLQDPLTIRRSSFDSSEWQIKPLIFHKAGLGRSRTRDGWQGEIFSGGAVTRLDMKSYLVLYKVSIQTMFISLARSVGILKRLFCPKCPCCNSNAAPCIHESQSDAYSLEPNKKNRRETNLPGRHVHQSAAQPFFSKNSSHACLSARFGRRSRTCRGSRVTGSTGFI